AALGIASLPLAVEGGRAWEVLGGPGALRVPVFNLVEAPPGSPHLHTWSTVALEILGVPFTGSSSAALWLTTDKLVTRAVLAAEGLPVAAGGRLDLDRPAVLDRVPPPWIVQPGREDASVGLEGNPVCKTRAEALARGAAPAHRFPGHPVLAEAFLPGRELNVSLLADGRGGVAALPVAEIEFVDFPPDLPQVLGYEAKWLTDSFVYTHTVRRFPAEVDDGPLLARVRELALAAFAVCGLAGYGP